MAPERSLASELAGIKDELKTFLQTRVLILRAEAKEKFRTWKGHLVMLGVALVLGITGWLTLVFTFVALLHTWIVGGSYGWFFGGVIVSFCLLVPAAICGLAGYHGIRASGVKPTRTLKILKQDQEWIQKQARTA